MIVILFRKGDFCPRFRVVPAGSVASRTASRAFRRADIGKYSVNRRGSGLIGIYVNVIGFAARKPGRTHNHRLTGFKNRNAHDFVSVRVFYGQHRTACDGLILRVGYDAMRGVGQRRFDHTESRRGVKRPARNDDMQVVYDTRRQCDKVRTARRRSSRKPCQKRSKSSVYGT